MSWFSRRSARVERKVDLILKLLLEGMNIMSAELDALSAQVAASATVEASAITLIQGLAAQIAAAGTDPAKLSALTASLNASATALAAAVSANTPAAPAPAV